MKQIKKLLTLIFAVAFLIFTFLHKFNIRSVSALGSLNITHNGTPISSNAVFTVENMLPGDEKEEEIKVENTGSTSQILNIQSEKTAEEKDFSQILDIEIYDGATLIYGPKKLFEFFNESSDPNYLLLGTIPAEGEKIFRIKVKFPASAGNTYQLAMVRFDLIFATDAVSNASSIVINEVYYDVDAEHGFDSPLDRGIVGINGNNVTIIIEDNAEGSTNTANVTITNLCSIVQKNNADIRNAVETYANTGGNSSSGNTGGKGSVTTGNSGIFQYLINIFNLNIGSCNASKLGQNHEWIELFNPTGETINLRRWSIEDNSGRTTLTNRNFNLGPGEFLLISKDSSTWRFWDEDADARKIQLGRNIGNGLGDDGDHLILRNADGQEVDYTAWGNDSFRAPWDSTFNPSASNGNSIERLTPGFDNDIPPDWKESDPPTPGS